MTKYMDYKFSKRWINIIIEVKIVDHIIPLLEIHTTSYKVSLKINGKFCSMNIRSVIFYETQCWMV
ncbi:hypothetical protein Lal_00010155 [Lupinus albus]|nr:hypothetical protein Lal_00010155 [Lupinus albus]